MSSIKPPDGRGPASGTPIAPEQGAGRSAPAGADFREALDRAEGARGPQAPAAPGAAGTQAGDALAELARMVRSGALGTEHALEQLIERTVSRLGRGLDDAQRAELTRVLRGALEADPALRALREGMEHGAG